MPIDPITPEESANRRNIRKHQDQIKQEIDRVIANVFKSLGGVKLVSGTFRLSDHPRLLKKVTEELAKFRLNVNAILANGIDNSFSLSQKAFIKTVYSAYDGRAIIDPVKAALNSKYDDVLQAFLNRSVNGLGLSDRIWQLTYQLQREIEWTVFAGLSEGQSAQQMSRSMRRFLKNPDSLFRRVRNAKGKLVLSANAKKFKPGQGVYRSSYKNAMRLSRTEINTAYRSADHEQYKRIPFVIGIEVRLSASHPRVDVCDYLVGLYPPTFKFVGFHPACLCYQIPILAPDKEFDEYQQSILKGTEKDFVFTGRITELPQNAKAWVSDNKERINGWKSEPWFIRDNKELKDIVRD